MRDRPSRLMPYLSLLQLDTQFPRIPGDVASPDTYDCALDIRSLAGLSVARVVSAQPDPDDLSLIEPHLCDAPGDVITTSCGFLSVWQEQLAARSPVPFLGSALMQLPMLSASFASDEVAILTFDADSLAAPAFKPALAGFGGPIVGLPPAAHLRCVIAGDLATLDQARAEAELIDLVAGVQQTQPVVRALLLECTNLPPYKAALRARFDVEIFDILTLIHATNPNMVKPAFL